MTYDTEVVVIRKGGRTEMRGQVSGELLKDVIEKVAGEVMDEDLETASGVEITIVPAITQ